MRRLVRHVGNVVADRVMGIDTTHNVSWAELGIDGGSGVPYQATSWRQLLRIRTILAELGISPRDTFIDFGAGKGRMLCLAARYPFRRVIGVELSAELCAVARRNVAANADRFACKEICIQTADAETYRVPDDVTVIYMNNPFTGDTFCRVVDNICASVARSPRTALLLYHHPNMRNYLEEHGLRAVRSAKDLIVYVVPVGAGSRDDAGGQPAPREPATQPSSRDGC